MAPSTTAAEAPRLLVDGRPGAWVPASDRGLQYGDGLFETLAVRQGRPCQWTRHLKRLALGCRRLGIEPPAEGLLRSESLALAEGRASGVLKILITRGDSGRGYRPAPGGEPRRVLAIFGDPGYPSEHHRLGVAVRTCATPATLNPALAGLKHLNRLDSVMARAEWSDPAIAEGLMLDPDGHAVGGTQSNLFLWDGRGLGTPAVDRCGVAGTVRDLVIEWAGRRRIPLVETRLTADDLRRAAGLFLTGSVAGVWPVRELDGVRFDPDLLPGELIEALHREALTPEEGLG
jgi:4-amino-4-deoxychorismate lyase